MAIILIIVSLLLVVSAVRQLAFYASTRALLWYLETAHNSDSPDCQGDSSQELIGLTRGRFGQFRITYETFSSSQDSL